MGARAERRDCAGRSSLNSPGSQSTTSYAWSRDGPATPSAQVVAALARALQLTNTERDHLYRLARLVPPTDGEISDHIPPGIHRVLNRLGDTAVAVFAADWQLIWWSRGWAALLGDPSSTPPALRNFARDSFPINGDGPRLSQWPVTSLARDTVEAAIVSDLRRATGRFPNDGRLTNLIQVLTTGNQRFAELWASGAVGAHREDHKIVEHPAVGPIAVDCDVMTDGDAELQDCDPYSSPRYRRRDQTATGFPVRCSRSRSWLRRTTQPQRRISNLE